MSPTNAVNVKEKAMKTRKAVCSVHGKEDVCTAQDAKHRMMSKAIHTPTPWEVGKGNAKGDCHAVFSSKDEGIADLYECTGDRKSNAAFIVRAVNSHDDLVRAVKDSHNLNIDLMVALKTIIKDVENGSLGNAVSVARWAIAKAEGK